MASRIFETTSGRSVQLQWDEDDFCEIVVILLPGKEMAGRISFRRETTDEDHVNVFRVTELSLDLPTEHGSLKRMGIGRKCMEIANEYGIIVFTWTDGTKRDDGSHLTGDGPAFATKMVKNGLAQWDMVEEDHEYHGADEWDD